MILRPEDLARLQEHFALRYVRTCAALDAHRGAFPVTTGLSPAKATEAMGAWFERTAQLERARATEAESLASTTAALLLGVEVTDREAVARVLATYDATGDIPSSAVAATGAPR